MAKQYGWNFFAEYVASDGGVTNSIKKLTYRVDCTDPDVEQDGDWITNMGGDILIEDNSESFDTITEADCKALALADMGLTEAQVQTKLSAMFDLDTTVAPVED